MNIIPQDSSEVTSPIQVNMDKETVSARELHYALGIEKRFSAWFDQYKNLFAEKGKLFPEIISAYYTECNDLRIPTIERDFLEAVMISAANCLLKR